MLSARIPSSRVTSCSAPSAPGALMARISASNRPASAAAAASWWERTLKASTSVAAEAPPGGDALGGDALGDEAVGVADPEAGAERVGGDGGAHRDPAHRLDAAGDHQVVGAGIDALGGEGGGLLRRAALAVDGGGGHRLGEAGGEHGVAGDVEGLLADLGHGAADDVVDLGRGRCRCARRGRAARAASRSTGWTPASAPVGLPFPIGRADGVDDHGAGCGPGELAMRTSGCGPTPSGLCHAT